ncbi:glutaredoxin 3 [Novosphingobium aquimarinum]|uniref:glutaredoxin 3 n=1 Tax=Novosphingobium aquimarinum TaxID=2682494 RepID=UPI0012EBC645|nr:glutaredoxin 3 [Novosphingobium aquimarinum]
MSAERVEIYTKWGCPYCSAAKSLLDKKGVAYTEYDVTMGGDKRREMVERVPGASTVPQIIVDGKALGGFDDINALDRQGKLDPLLGL